MARRIPVDLWRRRILHTAAAAAGLVAFAGCGRREPPRIGFLGGLSGRVADLGIGGRNGALIAIDDANAAGGIGGQAIELLVRDDEQNEALARTRAAELIDAGVQIIVGPMTSSIAVALAPLIEQREMPMISPTSTTHELSGRKDYFFRVVPDAPTGAKQEAQFLRDTGASRLAAVYDLKNRAFSESWTRSALRSFAELGGETALELAFESAPGVAYAELAQRLTDSRADTALLVTDAADAAVIAQHLRRRDELMAIATSPWAGTEQLIQMGGRGVDAALVPQYFDRESQAAPYLRFFDSHRRRFGEAPGFPAVNAYDATALAVRALRERGSSRSVLESLRAINLCDGLQRSFVIDENGDSRAPMFLTRVREGRYVPVGG
jgi:branched-chain amino acid transport system substrate-binding protein